MRHLTVHNCARVRVLLNTQFRYKTYIPKHLKQSYSTQYNGILKLSEEIESALRTGKPVVALETTIITHGMPYPVNLKTALEVEETVRKGGAVPATIGILNGRIYVGLNYQQLQFLSDPNTSSIKTSRRDLPFVISQGLNGGTTVSGTMIAARMAGIPIFVTGGIGGVHRGAESSMDVSADLTELSRTPITVISAGVKSILDIGRTLEYLETEGVSVSTFGSTREFPAFFTRQSGHMAPYQLKTATEAAHMIYSKECLRLQSGSLIAVPIPEQFDVLGQEVETVIQSVVTEAEFKNIQGKEITPYILRRVNELTEGKSLQANIHLIKNNAEVGTEIAVELNSIRKKDKENNITVNQSKVESTKTSGRVDKRGKSKTVTVVGGSNLDFTARMSVSDFKMNGATYPGSVKQSFGGVGRNIADGLSRLEVETLFISAIGDDSHRSAFEAHCSHMNLGGVAVLEDRKTATYCAVLERNGELMFGIGDMDIHKEITPQYISRFEDKLEASALVCIDGNLSLEAIEYVCSFCAQNGTPVLFDPTDLDKAAKPFQISDGHLLTYASPNFNELIIMASYLSGEGSPRTGSVDDMDIETVLHECSKNLETVSNYVPVVLVSLGRHGVVLCHYGDKIQKLPVKGDGVKRSGCVTMEHYSSSVRSVATSEIVSVSGAGDCMVAAFVSYLLQDQEPINCVRAGLLAGQISLRSSQAVPPNLTRDALSNDVIQREMQVTSRDIKR